MTEVNTTPEQATAEPNAASNNAPAEPVTENQTASAPSTEKADENHSEKTDEPKAEHEKIPKPAEPEEAEKSSEEQTKTDDNDSKKLHRNIENPTNSLDKSYNSNYPTDFVWDNFCTSDITANKKSHPYKYKGGRSGGAEENRTPVRKQIRRSFYTLSISFKIPSRRSDTQDRRSVALWVR